MTLIGHKLRQVVKQDDSSIILILVDYLMTMRKQGTAGRLTVRLLVDTPGVSACSNKSLTLSLRNVITHLVTYIQLCFSAACVFLCISTLKRLLNFLYVYTYYTTNSANLFVQLPIVVRLVIAAWVIFTSNILLVFSWVNEALHFCTTRSCR